MVFCKIIPESTTIRYNPGDISILNIKMCVNNANILKCSDIHFVHTDIYVESLMTSAEWRKFIKIKIH